MKEQNNSTNDVSPKRSSVQTESSPTPMPDTSDQNILPGKAFRQAGIYKISFASGKYVIGWAGDLYAKVNATVQRINDNVFPEFPKGTLISFTVLSSSRDDLKSIKSLALADPNYMCTLKRVKSSLTKEQRYLKKREKKKKVNPLIDAHQRNRKKGSVLEQLRARGGVVTDWEPKPEAEPEISHSLYVDKSDVFLDWDTANLRWRTRQP